jgi:hypothetical protein
MPPRERAVWVEPRWELRGGSYAFVAGFWNDGPATKEVIVRMAPPAPKKEIIVERPSPRHAWIAGHWVWVGSRHEWIRGHWDLPPQGKSVWVDARWDRRGEGFVFIEGFWR